MTLLLLGLVLGSSLMGFSVIGMYLDEHRLAGQRGRPRAHSDAASRSPRRAA